MAAMAAAVTALASPAFANSANADIAAPLRAAQEAKPGLDRGDQEFRKLFSSWRSLDKGANFAAASVAGSPAGSLADLPISIPTRVPVEGVRLTSDFGMRWHPVIGGHRMHKGLDLAGPVGTPVHAAADGVVGRADWFGGYGLYVQLEHGGSIETRYGHMSRLNVAAGQMVHKGDVIGYIGTTGRSTGPHLHYEVRVGGVAVNPLPYMQGNGAVTLASMQADAAHAGLTEAEGEAEVGSE